MPIGEALSQASMASVTEDMEVVEEALPCLTLCCHCAQVPRPSMNFTCNTTVSTAPAVTIQRCRASRAGKIQKRWTRRRHGRCRLALVQGPDPARPRQRRQGVQLLPQPPLPATTPYPAHHPSGPTASGKAAQVADPLASTETATGAATRSSGPPTGSRTPAPSQLVTTNGPTSPPHRQCSSGPPTAPTMIRRIS